MTEDMKQLVKELAFWFALIVAALNIFALAFWWMKKLDEWLGLSQR